MAKMTDRQAEYEYNRHIKRAEQRFQKVYKNRSLKCRLGFHRPYNMIGYPMLEVPLRCWYCEIPLKFHSYTFAARLSRFFLSFIGKDHWCEMIRTSVIDNAGAYDSLEVLECNIAGCTRKEYNLLRGG